MIYIDILPVQSMPLRVPYDLTSVDSWLLFRAYKKTLQVRPFDQRDVNLLQRRQRLRLEQDAATDHEIAMTLQGIPQSPGASGDASNAQLAIGTPPAHKRLRGPLLRERSGSISSQRDRANSMGSEFLGQSPFRPALSQNRKSVLGKPFDVEVALTLKAISLLRRIADVISVEVDHLALYFAPMNNNHTWEERRLEHLPMTISHRNLPMNEVLKQLKITNKANSKLCVFYRILPFGLLGQDRDEIRQTHRLADIYIADERLRYWRRLYLQHLRTRSAAISGTAGIPGEAEQDGNDSAPRSRANSECSGAGQRGSRRPREVTIDWPVNDIDPYDPLEENYVHIAVSRSASMDEVARLLLRKIGVPLNIDALEALKPRDNAAREALISVYRDQCDPCNAEEKAVTSNELVYDAEAERLVPEYPLLVYNLRERRNLSPAAPEAQAKSLVSFE